jgi:hypothetical protein
MGGLVRTQHVCMYHTYIHTSIMGLIEISWTCMRASMLMDHCIRESTLMHHMTPNPKTLDGPFGQVHLYLNTCYEHKAKKICICIPATYIDGPVWALTFSLPLSFSLSTVSTLEAGLRAIMYTQTYTNIHTHTHTSVGLIEASWTSMRAPKTHLSTGT